MNETTMTMAGRARRRWACPVRLTREVMRALYHHDVAPDGSPLETPGGRRSFERHRGTIDDHIEATVAAKVAELGNGGEGGTPGPGQQEIGWEVRPG